MARIVSLSLKFHLLWALCFVFLPGQAYAGIFKGSVIDEQTLEPIANAQLELFAVDTALTMKFTGYSNTDGSFYYDSVPDQRYYLRVIGGNYDAQWYSPQGGTTRYMQYGFYIGPAAEYITVALRSAPVDNPPASIVIISVKDSAGAVMNNGTVQLQNEKDMMTVAVADLKNNNGQVIFGNIQPGNYSVFLQCPPYTPQYYNPTVNSTVPNHYLNVASYDTVAITPILAAQPAGNGRITGKVMSETGQLMPGVAVILFLTNNLTSPQYRATTDTAGIFRFEQLIEQGYVMKLSSGTTYPEQWFSPQRHATTLFPDDPVYPSPTNDTFYVSLAAQPIDNKPSSVLFVYVFDSTGMPISSTTGKIEGTERMRTAYWQLQYDATGKRYRIEGIKAGEYSLRFEFSPYPAQYYSPAGMTAQEIWFQPVKEKDTVSLEVKLRTVFGPIDTTNNTKNIDGVISALPGYTPVSGARVLAWPSYARPDNGFNPSMLWSSTSVKTDSAGYFVFTGLPPGNYYVAAVADSQNLVTQFYSNADIPSRATSVAIDSIVRPTLNMALRKGGRILGTVKTEKGVPLEKVRVNAHEKNGQRWFEAYSDANGSFKIMGMPAGTWNFDVYHPDYMRRDAEPVTSEFTVSEGLDITIQTITMEPGGHIAGSFTAPFSLYDSSFSGTQTEGRYIGNLLLFPDSLIAADSMQYPWHSTGIRAFSAAANSTTGTFISDICPAGTWRAVFQPVMQYPWNDTTKTMPSVQPWLGWSIVGGDSALESGTVISITTFDTTKNISLSLRKGFTISGSVRDTTGTLLTNFGVSAMTRSGNRYFCIAFSERYDPTTVWLSGLLNGQDFFLNVWADGYPNQFWTPEKSSYQPLKPVRFDSASFNPLQITVRQLPADTDVTPDGGPIHLSGQYTSTGALQGLSWNLDQKYGFDTCLLYAKVRDSVTRTIAVIPVQQGISAYRVTETGTQGEPVRYIAVASGKGVRVRSNEIYFDPRNIGMSSDSLWISARGSRWGVVIEWGPYQSQEDSVSLFRRLVGGPWTLVERRSSWNTMFEDHSWTSEDSGKTFEYRVELLASRRASKTVAFKLDALFFAQLVKPLYVGPYEHYFSVQQAIDAAKNGDMIVVRPGTYRENINFKGKTLSLESDWQFGKPPVIDASNGIAITVPWTIPKEGEYPSISGFKITNAAVGVQTSIPLSVRQCLFTNVTRAFETAIDSVSMVNAMRNEPFLWNRIEAKLDQCTFLAGRSGSSVAVCNARGIAEAPGSSVTLPQGYEQAFITPVYSLGSYVIVSNSLLVNYFNVGASAELPIKLGGTTPGAMVSNCDFWNTTSVVSSPRIILENKTLTLDPHFVDTLYCFLPDSSALRTAAADRRCIGYDARRFEGDRGDDEGPRPTPVRGISARQTGLSASVITWNASPDSEQVVRYVVYRCPGDTDLYYVNQQQQWEPKLSDSQFTHLIDSFTTTTPVCHDSTMVPGVPYLYVVIAVDSAGRSSEVDLPASIPLAGLIVNRYRYTFPLKGQQWHMISPWGADAVALPQSSGATVYYWDDSRSADRLLSNYVAVNTLNPGKGYWFWPERDTILSVVPSTVDQLASHEAALSISCIKGRTGWNQIASPLPFPVRPSWLDSIPAWEWRTDSLGYTRATVLEPWKGYWVNVSAEQTLSLRSTVPAGKRAAREVAWQLQLALTGKGAWDPDNYIGVALHEGDAVTGIDEVLEPPAGFGGSQLYFIKNAGCSQHIKTATTRYSSLFRIGAKNRGETMEWRVALSAAQEKARIQVKGIGSLPAAFYAFWIERSRVIDLRKNAVVEVPPHEQELSGYCVVTANPDIVALYTDKLILKAAWPNPFGKSTNLTYVIPYDWLANGARVLDETRRVTIAIYDIRGRTIATLLDGAVAVGTHRTIWTGDDDNGNAVQSGVYIVRMTCNRLHATSRIFKIQ
jgi:hypothetical protein